MFQTSSDLTEYSCLGSRGLASYIQGLHWKWYVADWDHTVCVATDLTSEKSSLGLWTGASWDNRNRRVCVCIACLLQRTTTDLCDNINPLILFTAMAWGSELFFRFSELPLCAVDDLTAWEWKTWRLGSCSSTEVIALPKQELKHPALLELALKWELAYSAPLNIWMSLQMPSGLLRYSRSSVRENNVTEQPNPAGCSAYSARGCHIKITRQ